MAWEWVERLLEDSPAKCTTFTTRRRSTTLPPIRMCSPDRAISNSGRTNSRLPAGMRTPANPLTVPAFDVLLKIAADSRIGSVRVDLISRYSQSASGIGLNAVLAEVLQDARARG